MPTTATLGQFSHWQNEKKKKIQIFFLIFNSKYVTLSFSSDFMEILIFFKNILGEENSQKLFHGNFVYKKICNPYKARRIFF
jgi:hypothetical protein